MPRLVLVVFILAVASIVRAEGSINPLDGSVAGGPASSAITREQPQTPAPADANPGDSADMPPREPAAQDKVFTPEYLERMKAAQEVQQQKDDESHEDRERHRNVMNAWFGR